MIYHAKVFEKIETVTKIKYGEKMRDMKKINKANMCTELRYNLLSRNTSFDVNMWNLSTTYLYSIMASHVVPMCLIINHIRYMTDLVRMIKSAHSAISQRRVLRLITAKKNLLLRSNEPKSSVKKYQLTLEIRGVRVMILLRKSLRI